MQKQNSNQKLNDFNKKLSLNGRQAISKKEFRNMEKFAKAYEIELERGKRNKRITMLILITAGIASGIIILLMSLESIINELIKSAQ